MREKKFRLSFSTFSFDGRSSIFIDVDLTQSLIVDSVDEIFRFPAGRTAIFNRSRITAINDLTVRSFAVLTIEHYRNRNDCKQNLLAKHSYVTKKKNKKKKLYLRTKYRQQ